MSAWLLPDYVADVLPAEARRIEETRRQWLDGARASGYEQVIPPLIEHLESLLTGTGGALDLQTFKLVDQLSGRSMGVRADTTPQVARIDAHLLARNGVARLCYCGPVLHTRPQRANASREPLQFGAEMYGCASRQGDLEIVHLALASLRCVGIDGLRVDLGHSQIVASLLDGIDDRGWRAALYTALAGKDATRLAYLSRNLSKARQDSLQALIGLYGGTEVLAEAATRLESLPAIQQALDELRWLADRLPQAEVGFDLADARGWGYYSGMRFSVYAQNVGHALVRGGRYDGVGAIFAHKDALKRAAVGFSADLKEIAAAATVESSQAAIRAPWPETPELTTAIASLRQQGQIVVCLDDGDPAHFEEFYFDRKLIESNGQWMVVAL